jgi:hypothetical protein
MREWLSTSKYYSGWTAAGSTGIFTSTTSTGATFVKVNETLESVVKRSDSLMYIGKSNGRNKFTVG